MLSVRFTVAVLLFSLAGASGCGHQITAEEKKTIDDLHSIISAYIVTEGHLGQPPASVDDVRKVMTEPGLQNNVNLFDDGRYVVVWKTVCDPSSKDAATTVMAFEKGAYTKGGMVQMVNGVNTPYMSADALKAALKKNPAWDPALLESKAAAPKT